MLHHNQVRIEVLQKNDAWGTPRLSSAAIPKTMRARHTTSKAKSTARKCHLVPRNQGIGTSHRTCVMLSRAQTTACNHDPCKHGTGFVWQCCDKHLGKYRCHITSSCMHPCSFLPELILASSGAKINIEDLLRLFHGIFAAALAAVLRNNAQTNQR